MTKSRNSVVDNLNIQVVLASEEGKMPSNEVLEVPKDSGAPNYSDSSKIPDDCLHKTSEVGNLNVEVVVPEGKIYSNEAPEVAKELRAPEYSESFEIM